MKIPFRRLGLLSAASLLMLTGSAFADIAVLPAPGDAGKGLVAAAPNATPGKDKSSIVVTPAPGANNPKKPIAASVPKAAVALGKEPVGSLPKPAPVAKTPQLAPIPGFNAGDRFHYRASGDFSYRGAEHSCEDSEN